MYFLRSACSFPNNEKYVIKKGKKIIKLEYLDLFPSNNSNCPHSSTTNFIVSSD